MTGVILLAGRMPPCDGLAPCESLISIILISGLRAPRARGGRRGQMGLRGSDLWRRGGGWKAVCIKGRGRRLPRRVLCEELRIKLALPLEGRRLHVLAASEVARADVPHDVGAEQVVLADAALTCEAAGARVVPAGVAGGSAASARASPVLW